MPSRGSDADHDMMRWWLRNRDGVDDAQDRDVQRSCESKAAFPTEAHARASAAMNGLAGALHAYRCVYCEFWHLTRRKPF